MLRQAFLNLALNACQAMPTAARCGFACEPARGRRVSIIVHRHRRRHQAGAPAADLRPVFHDEGRRAAASACRWCIARFRCTTARLRYSRHQERAPRSASCCRRHEHEMRSARTLDSLRLACAAGAGCAGRLASGCCARAGASTMPELPPLDVPAAAAARCRGGRGRSRRRCRCRRSRRGTPIRASARRGAAAVRRRRRTPARAAEGRDAAGRAAEAAEERAAAADDAADDAGRSRKARSSAAIRATARPATADLNRVDYQALNADARTQYDTAQAVHQPGRGRAARRRTSSSRATWPTRRPRSRLSCGQ